MKRTASVKAILSTYKIAVNAARTAEREAEKRLAILIAEEYPDIDHGSFVFVSGNEIYASLDYYSSEEQGPEVDLGADPQSDSIVVML